MLQGCRPTFLQYGCMCRGRGASRGGGAGGKGERAGKAAAAGGRAAKAEHEPPKQEPHKVRGGAGW